MAKKENSEGYQAYSPERTLKEVVAIVGKSRQRWAVFGAWVLEVWGERRATADIDFLILSDIKGLHRITNEILAIGFKHDWRWRRNHALVAGKIMNRLVRKADIVDVVRAKDRFEESCLKKRVKAKIGGIALYVPTAADYILLKARAARPLDFQDAASVVRAQEKRLNYPYLRKTAIQLGVFEELQYIFTIL